MIMKFNKLITIVIGCLALFALPVSAETPILEELMRKYTFPLGRKMGGAGRRTRRTTSKKDGRIRSGGST